MKEDSWRKDNGGRVSEEASSIRSYLGGIWEASGKLEASGGPLNQEVHSLPLRCSQTAATEHSTAEWRRSEAQSTVKHMVLERTCGANGLGNIP